MSVDPLVDQTGQPYAYATVDPLNMVDPTGLCANGLWVCPWEWAGQQKDNAGAAWSDFYHGTGPIGGAVTRGFGAVADPAYAPEDVGQPLDMAHLRAQDRTSGVGSALPVVHGMDQLVEDTIGVDTSAFDYPNCLFQQRNLDDPAVRRDAIRKALAVGVGADVGDGSGSGGAKGTESDPILGDLTRKYNPANYGYRGMRYHFTGKGLDPQKAAMLQKEYPDGVYYNELGFPSRFGSLPKAVERRIDGANADELDALIARAGTIEGIEEL